MAVAAFLISTISTRLVRLEREQIAILKAFGFTNYSIAAHYMKFCTVVVSFGSAIGGVFGVWWASYIARIYGQFYRFPALDFRLRGDTLILVVLVSLATALFGSVTAARRAARLPPAEAMRPEAPATFRSGFIEKSGLAHLFPHVSNRGAQHDTSTDKSLLLGTRHSVGDRDSACWALFA